MLEVNSLTIRYADRTIVSDFSLQVREGEVVSIIGPNGSGKSTILKGLSRLVPCESGRVCIANQELVSLSTKQVSRIMCMRSDFFRLLLPLDFSRILSSCSMFLAIATGFYYAALCERSRKYWGFIAVGAAALILYKALVYRLNESVHYFEPRNLYPSSLMLLALSAFFISHGLSMMKRGTIA